MHGSWIRIVIKFETYKFKIWITPETEITSNELDIKERDKEYERPDPIEIYNQGLKEGRIGFFCSDCTSMMISSIQLWCFKCMVKDKKSTN